MILMLNGQSLWTLTQTHFSLKEPRHHLFKRCYKSCRTRITIYTLWSMCGFQNLRSKTSSMKRWLWISVLGSSLPKQRQDDRYFYTFNSIQSSLVALNTVSSLLDENDPNAPSMAIYVIQTTFWKRLRALSMEISFQTETLFTIASYQRPNQQVCHSIYDTQKRDGRAICSSSNAWKLPKC